MSDRTDGMLSNDHRLHLIPLFRNVYIITMCVCVLFTLLFVFLNVVTALQVAYISYKFSVIYLYAYIVYSGSKAILNFFILDK